MPGGPWQATKQKLGKVPPPWFVAVAVLLLLLAAVAIASLITTSQRRFPNHVCSGAQAVIRRAAQWSTSAQQDDNPVLRLVHINYAIAQINALRVILADADIERIAAVKPREMVASLREQQSQAIRKLGETCAGVKVQGVQGTLSGWR